MPADGTACAVLVVAYGPLDPLRECLTSVGLHAVLVVDNGQDERVRQLCAELGMRYVRADTNRGFAAGVNLGLAALDADSDVLLLNPDAVLAPGAVAALQTALHADVRLAAVAPRLVSPDGVALRVRWPMPGPAQVWRDALGLAPARAADTFVVGTCLLLRREALAQVGGFDERYFLYAEEADWQRRALAAGWKVGVAEDVVVVHAEHGSSADPLERTRRFTSSALLFADRWYGPVGAALYRGGAAAAACRRWLTRSGVQRREQAEVLRGVLGAQR
jgi:GT2 family glycosyltransferase